MPASFALRSFWRDASILPRAAMLLTAASGSVLALTYLGAGAALDEVALLAPFHIATLILGFLLFCRVAYHHAQRVASPPGFSAIVPRWLTVAVIAALVNLVGTCVLVFSSYPEGAPETRDGTYAWVQNGQVVATLSAAAYERFLGREVRLFASAWLFFGFLIVAAGHWVEVRLRYRSPLVAPHGH